MVKASVLLISMIVVIAVAGMVALAADQDKTTPKHTIKEVMASAHKAGLFKKVLAGDASQDEKFALLDYYVSLAENSPNKGSKESWAEKTNAVVLAAAKVAVGRDGGTMQLKNVANCSACHNAHR